MQRGAGALALPLAALALYLVVLSLGHASEFQDCRLCVAPASPRAGSPSVSATAPRTPRAARRRRPSTSSA
eukprot:251373-Alexandrium_andersonii.AAC.1